MNERIKQRIAYLIEHGGVYPKDDRSRFNLLAGFMIIMEVTHLALEIMK